MKIIETLLGDVKVLEPTIFKDERGFFQETWNAKSFESLGLTCQFVQDNHSRSVQGTLRGLHFQWPHTQGRLVRVVQGLVIDVSVDIRPDSRTFGQHVMVELSAENGKLVWIPPGFAHGFYVLSGTADFLYKTTDYYTPDNEHTLLWSDPGLAIAWPIQPGTSPVLSPKDANGQRWDTLRPLLARTSL